MSRKKDIMDKILSGDGGEDEKLTKELDCLIYRSGGEEAKVGDPGGIHEDEDTWKVTRDNVSVQVWETSGRIRLRVSLGKSRRISMKQIAEIAVEAIVQELKKEE